LKGDDLKSGNSINEPFEECARIWLKHAGANAGSGNGGSGSAAGVNGSSNGGKSGGKTVQLDENNSAAPKKGCC
jgi:hypothetical protein